MTCNYVASPRGALAIGRSSERVSLVLQDRNELANYMLGKLGSLSLFLACPPLRFRTVSFECPMAQTGSTVSVRVWAMMTNREPRGKRCGKSSQSNPKGKVNLGES